jgi:putative inorganic carbon (hco3(-)) transporter
MQCTSLPRPGKGKSLDSSIQILVGLLVVTAFIGLAVSLDTSLSLNRLSMLVVGVIVFFLVIRVAHSVRMLERISFGLIAVGCLVAVFSLFATDWSMGVLIPLPAIYGRIPLLVHNLPGSGVPQFSEGLNPRLVAGTMAFLLPLPLAWATYGQRRRLRWLGWLSAGVMAVPLVLSQSPQGFLGLGLALGVMWVWCKPRRLGIVLAIAVALSVTWVLYRWWLPELLIHRLEIGIAARLGIWPKAWLMIRDMPFTGAGLNNFPIADGLYSLTASHEVHAHNVFLQTAVDQGVLGLVAFIALFASALIAGWRAYRASIDPSLRIVVLGCAGGCIAYLGFGLWDAITLGHKPAPALWVMLGLLIASERLAMPLPSTLLSVSARRKIIAGLSLIVIVAAPVWGSALATNLGRITWNREQAGVTSATTEDIKSLADVAIALFRANSRARLLAGQIDLRAGHAADAVAHLEQAVTLDHSDPVAYFQLAEAHEQLGHLELAFEFWRAAGAASRLYERGTAARRTGDLTQAEYWFSLVTQLDGSRIQYGLALARVQVAEEQWAAALQTYSGVIDAFPQTATGYEELAGLLYQRHEKIETRLIVDRGLARVERPSPQLYYFLSKLEADEADWNAAEQAVQQALALAPANGTYRAWQNDLWLRQKRYTTP